jgi:hypothetical protein
MAEDEDQRQRAKMAFDCVQGACLCERKAVDYVTFRMLALANVDVLLSACVALKPILHPNAHDR